MSTTISTLFSGSNIVTAKWVITTAASVATTAMVARSIAHDYLADEIHDYFSSSIRKLFTFFSSEITILVDEFDGLVTNEVYQAAETYLGTKISTARRFKAKKQEREKIIDVTVDRHEEIVDVFNGVKIRWFLATKQVQSRYFYNPRDINSTLRSEVRFFELSFHKKFKNLVLESYLPYVMDRAKTLNQEKKTLKIFTVDHESMSGGDLADMWMPVPLDHPARFETLAMDSALKNLIIEDLDRFLRRKEYYRRVGKAWKRGYLLFGPPGTGKSSLIGAMANYLNFDVYDLELTELNCNSDLRKLLLATANRSILVVEDIDCTIDFTDREAPPEKESNSEDNPRRKKVTLSGFLNFIDGLWSSCGDERIIVFTTNHKEKLDAALLRPGRMDVHIHLAYCTPEAFRILAFNYLGIKEHSLFGEIEEAILGTEVTPAEVAEQLMRDNDAHSMLNGFVEFLKAKKIENEEAKEKKKQEEREKQKKKLEVEKRGDENEIRN